MLDAGATVYRWYFMRKWHRALDAKKRAFPERYDFRHTYNLRGVGSTTDYFVREHTHFATPRAYFAHYTLTDDFLADLRIPTRILAAKDDPVIPHGDFARVRPTRNLTIDMTETGGHCAYIEDLARACYADRYAVDWFSTRDARRRLASTDCHGQYRRPTATVPSH
jgi:predicted alpha/beta-fold hydrolase